MRYALVICAGFAAASAVMMLWWPLGYDQGIFALNGATLLRGGLPYRDAWETRGPLAFYLFAAIEWTLGRSGFAIRLFDVLLLALVDVMMWRTMRRWGGRAAATLLACGWTLTVVSLGFSHTAQPDLWVGYAVLAAILLCVRPGGYGVLDVTLAGVLVGLCALLKPFYAGFLIAPAVIILLSSRGRAGIWPAARDLAVLGGAFLLPVVVTGAALWVSGAWEAFVQVHFWYNVRVYANSEHLSLSQRVIHAIEFVVKGKIIVVAVPAIVAGAFELWRRDRAFAAAVLLALLVGAASVVLQGRFYYYHWAPVLVLSAPLAALGLLGAIRAPASRALGWATLAVIGLHVSLHPLVYLGEWGTYLAGRKTSNEYLHMTVFGEKSWVDPAEQLAAARYIQSHTPRGAPIANWGWDAAVPFLADRPGVSRFPVAAPLMLGGESEVTREYRREFVDAMRASRPPYLVIGNHAARLGVASERHPGQEIPELGALLAGEYVLDRRFGDLDLYRRTDYTMQPGK